MNHWNDDGSSKTIGTLETTISLLEALEQNGQAGVTELANSVNVSKSTVHHHLATLQKHRFVQKNEEGYRLGHRFLTYGGSARERETIYSVGKHEVDALADETNECVQIVVEELGKGIYLYQADGNQSGFPRLHVGGQIDLHCTAAGKVILAQRPREHVKAVIERHGLPRYTDNTITSREALFEELDRIREHEVGFDDEEQFDGIRCVASPITSESGELLGAICLSGPTDRLANDRFKKKIPNFVQDTAGVIETNTAYRSWSV